jgi:hypothetical protein
MPSGWKAKWTDYKYRLVVNNLTVWTLSTLFDFGVTLENYCKGKLSGLKLSSLE